MPASNSGLVCRAWYCDLKMGSYNEEISHIRYLVEILETFIASRVGSLKEETESGRAADCTDAGHSTRLKNGHW